MPGDSCILGKEITHSNPHKSYSRIDAFWTNQKILSNTWETKIHNNMHSDHAPISISFSHSKCYARSSNWKFNNSLLLNPSFIEHVKVNTKAFFEINTESVNSFSMIWEAYKATCRGWVISYATQEKKQRMKRIEELTVALNITEQQPEANPKSKEIYLNLVKTQTELGDLLNKKLEFALFKLKSINYDTGDKAGKLLAHHLQKLTTSRQTLAIASHNKDILTDSDLINKRLKEYFSELYRSEYNPSVCSPNPLDIFFKKVNLSKLSLEDRGYLEADITMLEVANAIKSLNSNIAPGEDGFSVNFYKAFIEDVQDKLIKVYQEAKKKGSFSTSLNTSLITLIPKPNKDPLRMYQLQTYTTFKCRK